MARQESGAQKLEGHDIMALERFDPEGKFILETSRSISDYVVLDISSLISERRGLKRLIPLAVYKPAFGFQKQGFL